MAVSKTLKGANSSQVKTGYVQIQPQVLTDQQIVEMNVQSTSTSSSKEIFDASSKKKTLNLSPSSPNSSNEFSRSRATTLYVTDKSGQYYPRRAASSKELVDIVSDGVDFIVGSKAKNVIVESAASQKFPKLSSDYLDEKSSVELTYFEKATGLLTSAPEIVSIVHFVPFFSRDGKPTPERSFARLRRSIGVMRVFDMVTSARKFAIESSSSQQTYSRSRAQSGRASSSSNSKPKYQFDSLQSVVDSLQTSAVFMNTVRKLMQGLKDRMNLRNLSVPLKQSEKTREISDFGFATAGVLGLQEYGYKQGSWEEALSSRVSILPEKFTIVDFLSTVCLYSRENVMTWSSSKMWTQMSQEVGRILTRSGEYTGHVVGSQVVEAHSSDRNQVITNTYGLMTLTVPSLLDSCPVSNYCVVTLLSNLSDSTSRNKFCSELTNTFKQLSSGVRYSSSTGKISVILDSLSKEFRYSKMITSKMSVDTLVQTYGVSSTTTRWCNVVFPAVFNTAVSNVFSRPAQGDATISGLSRSEYVVNGRSNVVSLFEPVRIENADSVVSTLVSGGEHYVDSVFDIQEGSYSFNVKHLQTLVDNLTRASESLMTLVDDGNFMCVSPNDDSIPIENPSAFVKLFVDELVVSNGTIRPDYTFSNVPDKVSLLNSGLAGIDEVLKTLNNPLPGLDIQFTGFGVSRTTKSIDDVLKVASVTFMSMLTFSNQHDDLKALIFQYLMSLITYNTTSETISDDQRVKNSEIVGKSCSLLSINYIVNVAKYVPKLVDTSSNSSTVFLTSTDLYKIFQTSSKGGFLHFVVDVMTKVLKKVLSVSQNPSGTFVKGLNLTDFESQFRASMQGVFGFGLSQTKSSSVDPNTKLVTTFSGTSDVAYMSAVFDVICSIVAELSDTTIVSIRPSTKDRGPGIVLGSVAKKSAVDSSNSMLSAVDEEVSCVRSAVVTLVGYVNDLTTRSKNLLEFLTRTTSVDALNTFVNSIGDKNLLQTASSERQVKLLLREIRDLKDRSEYISSTDGLTIVNDLEEYEDIVLDDVVSSDDQETMVDVALSTSKFSSDSASNVKILSVGLTTGLVNELRQKIDASKKSLSAVSIDGRVDFSLKQSDVILIRIYKTDVDHPELLFKPLNYMFDMSLFVMRFSKSFKPLSPNPTFSDVILSIPMLDVEFNEWAEQAYSYGYNSLDSVEYSFLSNSQKKQIVDNHVMSYLLELYVRMITGLDIDERKFHIEPPPSMVSSDFVKSFLNSRINSAMNSSAATDVSTLSMKGNSQSSTLFGTSTSSDARSKSLSKTAVKSSSKSSNSLTDDTPRIVDEVIEKEIDNVSSLKTVRTRFSDPQSLANRLVSPKKFDRVFHIAVDPSEFVIDRDATIVSESGKIAFERLCSTGEIYDESLTMKKNDESSYSQYITSTESMWKMKKRSRREGDYSFERYFVSVETSIAKESD